MRFSARVCYNITDELVKEYFPDGSIPSPAQLLETIFEDFPNWEDEFADYWTDWRLEE